MRAKLILVLMGMIFLMQTAKAQSVPRPEHPRPDFMREDWQNLNGEWEFAFDPKDRGLKDGWQDQGSLPDLIVVPFPIESELSGVGVARPPDVNWYLKRFTLAPGLKPNGGRVLLNFGAVDYKTTVWLNGSKLGGHVGGYTPFSFDITDYLAEGENVLVVRVFDELEKMQVRGKQTASGRSHSIVYTTVSGIWQTVWLERTGPARLASYRFYPSADLSGGRFKVELDGAGADAKVAIEIGPLDGAPSSQLEVTENGAVWKDAGIRPWSPDSPNLYRVVFTVVDGLGRVSDRVESYVGVRTIEVVDGRIMLNGKPFYQKLLLDQGYYPGGIYAPADDAIMRSDCEMYKAMGFNGLRKHQKVEDPRFLYWCDRVGLVVWGEMPALNMGAPRLPPAWAREAFMREWKEFLARDVNHPSVIVWAPFNETWGLYSIPYSKGVTDWAYDVVKTARNYDSTRLVCDNSGGLHFDTDIWDFHHYLATDKQARDLYETYDFQPGDRLGYFWYIGRLLKGQSLLPNFTPGTVYEGQPVILSEYGAFGFFYAAGNMGLLEFYREYTLAINDFPYIQGYCYTQPYDVEQERDGLMTFERELKVDPEEIRKINEQMGR